MNPEDKKLLEETLELAEDNNRILKKLLRAQRLGIFVTSLKWLIIIAGAVGLYYLFQPVLDQLREVYSGLGNIYQSAGSIFNGQ